jgi:pseudoazurin
MRISSLALAALLAALGAAAAAATHEVQLLNRGEQGAMVFEPAYVAAQPGDTIVFKATDPGHNVAAIEGMLPEGVEAFESELGQDFELTVTAEGLYGVECTPHAGMGMVGLIQVGAPANREAAQAAAEDLRGKAKERMGASLELVTEDVAAAAE